MGIFVFDRRRISLGWLCLLCANCFLSSDANGSRKVQMKSLVSYAHDLSERAEDAGFRPSPLFEVSDGDGGRPAFFVAVQSIDVIPLTRALAIGHSIKPIANVQGAARFSEGRFGVSVTVANFEWAFVSIREEGP
jgi:hypothetical protein